MMQDVQKTLCGHRCKPFQPCQGRAACVGGLRDFVKTPFISALQAYAMQATGTQARTESAKGM